MFILGSKILIGIILMGLVFMMLFSCIGCQINDTWEVNKTFVWEDGQQDDLHSILSKLEPVCKTIEK